MIIIFKCEEPRIRTLDGDLVQRNNGDHKDIMVSLQKLIQLEVTNKNSKKLKYIPNYFVKCVPTFRYSL